MTNPHVLSAIKAQPWAITEEWLQTILAIAARENPSIEAVEAQLGRKLDNSHAVTMRGPIATIPIEGPIVRYADFFSRVSGATSVDTLGTDLGEALANPEVQSIILYIDSPGGEVNGISEFAAMVHGASKPVVAYVAGLACSAAYWIASASSEVVISDTAMLGSLGVICAVDDQSDEEGVVTFISSQSPNKRPDPQSESGKSQIQAMVDDIASVFVASVAQYRDVSVDTVLSDFGQGGVFVGQKAVDAKLADRMGSYESVLAELTQSNVSQPSRLAASTKSVPQPTRRAKMSLRDLFRTVAQEKGVDYTESEMDAVFNAPSAAEEMKPQLAERDAKIAALEDAQADRDAKLAEAIARADRLEADSRRSVLTAAAKGWQGDTAEHVAFMESLPSDELREQYRKTQDAHAVSLTEALKMASAFKPAGVSGLGSADSPLGKIEQFAQQLRAANPKLTIEQARAQATIDHPELYEEYDKTRYAS